MISQNNHTLTLKDYKTNGLNSTYIFKELTKIKIIDKLRKQPVVLFLYFLL